MDINKIKRIGKVAEDFSRIWQVKSSEMIEILPEIFKKTFLFLFFVKISRNPPDRSSGRLRPARAGSGQLGPAWADSGQLVFIKKSTAAGKRFLDHKNRPCKRHPILEDPSSLIAKHKKSLRFLKSPHPNDIFECGILELPTRVGPGE